MDQGKYAEHTVAATATKAATNAVEQMKVTIKRAEEMTKTALDSGIYAAQMAQDVASVAEGAAIEAEKEYRKIFDKALLEKEKILKYTEEKGKKLDEIMPFAALVSMLDNAYKEASSAAIAAEAAKEDWKHTEKAAWLFKATEALRTDRETGTVDAAAVKAKNAVKEASKRIKEYNQAEEKSNAAIQEVAKTLNAGNEEQIRLSKDLLVDMKNLGIAAQKEGKALQRFEKAAKEAEKAVAEADKAWLALKESVNAQNLEKTETEHKPKKIETKDESNQSRQLRLQQPGPYEDQFELKDIILASVLLLFVGISAMAPPLVLAALQAYYARRQAIEAAGIVIELAELGIQNFQLNERPNAEPGGEQEELMNEAEHEEMLAEAAADMAQELANEAVEEAEHAIQAEEKAAAARDDAAARTAAIREEEEKVAEAVREMEEAVREMEEAEIQALEAAG